MKTGDGTLALAVGNDAQFARLCAELGAPELSADPRFATNGQRVAHRDALIDELERHLQTDSASAWADRLMDAGVPAGTIGTVADGFALAERLGLSPVVEVDGATAQTRSPLRLSRTPITAYRRPPRLDEHGDEIRRWLDTDVAAGAPEGETHGIP